MHLTQISQTFQKLVMAGLIHPENFEERSIGVAATIVSSNTVSASPAESFACLNDVFAEMIIAQHPLSMSKWETGNAAVR
jgi:hypothetical protein